ncbi:hypothetical protein O0L34_g450 [Tuta absoluta]|nr:hypothetical protein O0L34_g450 [Tuta absoluta]
MPVSSRRNQEEILPYLSTESLAPKKQSKPIHKIPDETLIDSVGRSAEPNPKSNFKVPLKQNTQQVDRQGIESQPGFLTQIKAQHPQVYDTENRESPQLNSEEVKELIQRHNNDIPSHQDAIHYVPVQNRTIEPQKSHNYHDFTSTNLNREAEPSEDNHIHIINTLKPKPIHDRTTSSESCNIERKDSYEDLLPEGRRAMSKGSTNDTDKSLGLQSPTTETLRSGQASAKTILQQPNVLTKPTYQLSDPTRGAGIAPLSEVRGLLMESSRVCFACSTLNDASCTIPDRTTTIKYCRQGQEVCVTKSYRKNAGARLVVIRDCGTSCDADTSGLNTRYESCAVCKEDLCNSLNIENSAFSISAIDSIFVLLCTALVKHIF